MSAGAPRRVRPGSGRGGLIRRILLAGGIVVLIAAGAYALLSGGKRASWDAAVAAVLATAGAGGALLVLPLFSRHLRRAVLRPIRRTSATARDLASGDLSVRIPEVSRNDVGVLERTFNVMAGSLQADRRRLRRVAEEQGALRRVATLAARGVSPAEIFTAVASELGRVEDVEYVVIDRFDPASEVFRTGRTARTCSRENHIRCVVGYPITVGGRLWGMITVFSPGARPPSESAERRLGEFVELLGTAIAGAENRDELLASSARIVTASDEDRHHIERSLSTGPLRRLTALGADLRAVRDLVGPGEEEVRGHLARTAEGLDDVLDDLREISHGVRPAALSRGGLRRALESLVQRSEIPAELTVRVGRRLPEHLQVALYYTVSEALTNVAKYSGAGRVTVDLRLDAARLTLRVTDDGVGGADPSRGSGLLGLKDRVEGLGGTIEVISPVGGGTSLLADVPLAPAL